MTRWQATLALTGVVAVCTIALANLNDPLNQRVPERRVVFIGSAYQLVFSIGEEITGRDTTLFIETRDTVANFSITGFASEDRWERIILCHDAHNPSSCDIITLGVYSVTSQKLATDGSHDGVPPHSTEEIARMQEFFSVLLEIYRASYKVLEPQLEPDSPVVPELTEPDSARQEVARFFIDRFWLLVFTIARRKMFLKLEEEWQNGSLV